VTDHLDRALCPIQVNYTYAGHHGHNDPCLYRVEAALFDEVVYKVLLAACDQVKQLALWVPEPYDPVSSVAPSEVIGLCPHGLVVQSIEVALLDHSPVAQVPRRDRVQRLHRSSQIYGAERTV
jgi:hypothetical protein